MTEVGQVRFFDHKKGFGFIDVLDNDSSNHGKEIFFHYSEIKCDSTFKKVIPGELVEFDIVKNTSDDPDKNQKGVNIRGVRGATMLIDHPDFVYKFSKKHAFNGKNDDDNVEESKPSSEADGEN